MSVPNIGTISGTPNTGLENSLVFIRDVDPVLYFYETNKHPIASMLLTNGATLGFREGGKVPAAIGKIRKEAAKNFKIEFFEDQIELADYYKPTAAVTAAATSLTVSSTDDDHFRAGDVLLLTNASGQTERLIIASVAANTLNVTNTDGTTRTAGIVMTTADKFYRMENARAEDSTAPAIRTTKRAEMYNYLEIISETYGLTRTKKLTSDYNGDPLMLEKRKALSRLMYQLEKMFWYGTRDAAATTTNPIYHTGGFNYFAELYSDVDLRDFNGLALTRAELMSFLTSVAKSGSATKKLVCGSRALNALGNMGFEFLAKDSTQIGDFGFNITKIATPLGDYDVVYEPLFDTVDISKGDMVVLDMANVKYRYLNGFDIGDEPQYLADGSLSEKSQYVGQVGFQFNTMKEMGRITNIGA